VKADKRLGQHFLTDRSILQRIVEALVPAPDDVVLEIGAGKGSLTEQLLARGLRVIAIEKDRRLAAELEGRGTGEEGRVVIAEGDALRLDWHALVTPLPPPSSPVPFKIVGNIPYNITSPLIEKALTPPLPDCIVFLVQAEVAERLAAAPGSKPYGALSVGVQAVCRVEKLFRVRAGAFTPPPRVHSAVVRLTPLAEPLVAPAEIPAFRAFVTACFTRRRKQLRNVLLAATHGEGELASAAVVAGLEALGLDPTARPETLAPATFVRLLRWSARL
jgi:16S rRNA (adenine1518-N6/adenine1519-N6)-dimethyltransferase